MAMDASFTAYALRQAVRAAAADDTSRIPAQHGQLVVMEGAVGHACDSMGGWNALKHFIGPG